MVVSSYGADVTSNLFAHSKSSALEQQLTLTISSGMAAHSTSTSSSDPNNVFAVADSAESIRNLQSGRSESSLSTAFNQNRGDDGNMFQVNAMACVVIRYMHVNALGGGVNALGGNYGNVEVYTKQGPLLPSDATSYEQFSLDQQFTDICGDPNQERAYQNSQSCSNVCMCLLFYHEYEY